MREAAILATRVVPHGTVVVAETQTAGIGRHGNSWHSDSDGGLYLSIILRLSLPPDLLPLLTMALGLAVQHAVNGFAAVACDLRWPNDVLLNGKKLAGTLVQSGDGALIAGMGVNVNQTEFPPELRDIATSLRIETNQVFSKDDLLNRVAEESLKHADLLARQGKRPILEQFEARSSYVRGRAVAVEAAGRNITGITEGLDEDGYLRVRTAEGLETIIAGGVRPLQ